MTASFALRPATAADQASIKRLIRAVGINRFGLDWQRFLVAVSSDGAFIGCGQVKEHGDGSRELASIAVAPAWRRQGVASAIVRELMARHERPLWLTCASPRTTFYTRFGFEEVTAVDAMPPYFRRIVRLANFFFRFSRRDIYLAVMVCV